MNRGIVRFVLVRVNSWIALSPKRKTIHEIHENNTKLFTYQCLLTTYYWLLATNYYEFKRTHS